MALQLPMPTSPLGVGFPDAYVRVSRVSGNKDVLNAMVEIHANEAARKSGAQHIQTRVHTFPMPADAPLYPAVYGALKLLPEYAGAVDC